MSARHWTLETAVCTGCKRAFPRLALDTTGRCPTCPAGDALPCVNRLRVADVRRVLPLCIAVLFGRLLTPWDHALMAERADAARDAWIAAMEAEGDAALPALPGELAWCDRTTALVPMVGGA